MIKNLKSEEDVANFAKELNQRIDKARAKNNESNIIDFESLRKTSFDNTSVNYDYLDDYIYEF